MSKNNDRALLAATLVGLAALGAMFVGCAPAAQSDQKTGEYVVSLCPTEDSEGPCWWDADIQGNGTGVSFLVTKNGDVYYLLELPTCADAPEFDCLTGEGLGR